MFFVFALTSKSTKCTLSTSLVSNLQVSSQLLGFRGGEGKGAPSSMSFPNPHMPLPSPKELAFWLAIQSLGQWIVSL